MSPLQQRLDARRELIRAPRERIEALVRDKLAHLLEYAFAEVPLYRRRWTAAGVTPASLAATAGLEGLPSVSKAGLAENVPDWTRFERGKAGICTKGTTGRALVLWLDRDDFEATLPGVIDGFEQSGLRRGDRVLLLNPVIHRMSALESAAARFLGARPVYVAGSMLDQSAHVPAWLDTLARYRPRYVTVMTPLLLDAIKSLDEAGADVVRAFSSVGTLMIMGLPVTPELREHLRRRTGVAELWDRGGSTEGLAMDECELHDGQHVYEDTVHTEVVDGRGAAVPDGERGALLITKLDRTPSPMIRYETGDVACHVLGTCACGRTFRRLRLFGREESGLRVDGRLILAWDVRQCLDEDPDLVGRNLLLVRDARGFRGVNAGAKVRLRVVIEGEARNAAALSERIERRLGLSAVALSWTGAARLRWSYRQVAERSELPNLG